MQKIKSICHAPWSGIHICPNGDTYPCCMFIPDEKPENIHKKSIIEIYNSERFKAIRREMMDGSLPDACIKCKFFEDIGAVSPKQAFDALLKDITDYDFQEHVDVIDFKYMDFRFSNLCNLSCITCCSEFSSLIASEAKIKNPVVSFMKTASIDLERDLLVHTNPRKIYFAGGEPLITEEHFEMLRYYINKGIAKDIIICYNTNLTKLTWKEYNLVELWKHFADVRLGISIDHFGRKLEYIRHPVKSLVIEKNLATVKSYSETTKLEASLAPTVSIFNIYDLIEIKNYYKDFPMYWNVLMFPVEFSIQYMPEKEKQFLIEKYSNDQHFSIIVNALKEVNTNPIHPGWVYNKRLKEIRRIEAVKQLKFNEYFPEEHHKWIFNQEENV